MQKVIWICLAVLVLVATPAAIQASDYATLAGPAGDAVVEKPARSLAPIDKAEAKDKAAKRDYALEAEYTYGYKTGDLRGRIDECRVESYEEPYGVYHVNFDHRGESRFTCSFGYRYDSYKPKVRLRLYHKATVPGESPIHIQVNGKTVVYGWSPSSRYWHHTEWEISEWLRPGANEIIIRLSYYASKQYWLKRIALVSSSDCLLPNSEDPDAHWRRVLQDAQYNFDDGRYYLDQFDYAQARREFRECIRKCHLVEDNANDVDLKDRARRLRQRAQYQLNDL